MHFGKQDCPGESTGPVQLGRGRMCTKMCRGHANELVLVSAQTIARRCSHCLGRVTIFLQLVVNYHCACRMDGTRILSTDGSQCGEGVLMHMLSEFVVG